MAFLNICMIVYAILDIVLHILTKVDVIPKEGVFQIFMVAYATLNEVLSYIFMVVDATLDFKIYMVVNVILDIEIGHILTVVDVPLDSEIFHF